LKKIGLSASIYRTIEYRTQRNYTVPVAQLCKRLLNLRQKPGGLSVNLAQPPRAVQMKLQKGTKTQKSIAAVLGISLALVSLYPALFQ
jgi:hypothetical protein